MRLFSTLASTNRPSLRWLAAASLALAGLAACGGGSSDDSAPIATNADAALVSAVANESAPGSPNSGTAFAGEGSATRLTEGGSVTLNATLTGRDCAADGFFGSCRGAVGAGGAFAVSALSDQNDFAKWTATIHCGSNPGVPVASVTAKQLVAFADLTMDPYGEIVGVALHAENGAEAMLAYQPAGDSCPRVFGLGAIEPNSIMTGGNGNVGFTRPGGGLACATAAVGSGFTVTESTC